MHSAVHALMQCLVMVLCLSCEVGGRWQLTCSGCLEGWRWECLV